MKTNIDSNQSLDSYIEYLRSQFEIHKYLRIDMKTGKQRTNLQNASLHKFCDDVAKDLNEEGITFNKFFKEGVEVPWTMQIVKDNIWRPIQKIITNHSSTTKPETTDYPKIYEVINRKLAQWGIHVKWPTKENQYE